MKLAYCSIALLILISAGFIMSNKGQEYHPSEGEQLVNSLLPKAAGVIQIKYKIKPCGVGVSMPGGPIQELALCFSTNYPYNKEELRKLLIRSAQELLSQVNQNQEIQKFIKDPPFTIKNVQIIIYNHDKNGGTLYDPEILTAQILQGTLTYSTVEATENSYFKSKNDFMESYEEALKMFQSS